MGATTQKLVLLLLAVCVGLITYTNCLELSNQDQKSVTLSSSEFQSLLSRLSATEERLQKLEQVSKPILNWGYINVANAPYNAQGTGVVDDGPSIQNALNDCATAGGGIVLLPAGTYLVSTRLTIHPSCTLKGINEHPWRSHGAPGTVVGTTLLAVADAGQISGVPFINLVGPNTGIEGLSIFYPNQIATAAPTRYPFTVGGSGDNLFVKNVLFVNSYQGIDFATQSCPRHLIQGVYGQMLYIGIQIDQVYDIGRISDVHIWPFWSSAQPLLDFINNNAITFLFYRSDWEVVSDVFSWGYKIGMSFQQSKNGALNGQFTNINFDNVDIGILVNHSQPWGLMFSNLNLANAGGGTKHISIWGVPGGNCEMVVRGLSVWGSVEQGVLWESQGTIQISDGLLQPSPNPKSTTGFVDVRAGDATLRTSYYWNQIANKKAIHIGAQTGRVIVADNDLVGNQIINEGKTAIIVNNIA
eukprot:TRINITY_DN21820_c0_g1_i1.p1 TRINITY_DN21820_c0_g1~~TRINITY_DN21820_c0_g1_i1.p1  ORF type:complete len:496 (+),score=95.78 TRINITY_DN21820_c0_g1_i1:77-1489(+)